VVSDRKPAPSSPPPTTLAIPNRGLCCSPSERSQLRKTAIVTPPLKLQGKMRFVSQPMERIVAFSLQDGISMEVQQKVATKQ